MQWERIYKNAFYGPLTACYGHKGYVKDGGGLKDSENTLNLFLIKCRENVFWQIGTDMGFGSVPPHLWGVQLQWFNVISFILLQDT